jgi:tetratricopeptide (TPR) repeat protein
MKKNYTIVALLLFFALPIQAQKNQIKSAEKEVSDGNPQDALTILKSIEYQVYNSKDEERAFYYLVKGDALSKISDTKIDEGKNLVLAAQSYQEVIKIEAESGKNKYSGQAKSTFKNLKEKLTKNAVLDIKLGKYIESANLFYEAYLIDCKDTINLYNSATSFTIGKDYISALKHYETLKSINFSGTGKFYYAVNKATNTEERFLKEYERDNAIAANTHIKERNEIGLSKRGEIYKNIALIHLQNGDLFKSKNAILDARAKNPEDITLALAEAELCLASKDFINYNKIVTSLLKNNPNDYELIFNLGVLSCKAKNNIEAENYFLKAITIAPKDAKSYINLTVLKLESANLLNEDMNKLGTSPSEMIKYDALKTKKEEIYKSTIPYLKRVIELDPKDIEIKQSLLSVYNALEMTTEYNELKATLS